MSPVPVRVLVRGSSIATQVAYWGGSREDLAYPRVVEQELLGRGIAVDVRNRARIAERTSMALRAWEVEVSTWSPDVLVLHFGYAETIHLFLPRFLERHVNSEEWRPHGLNRVYRRAVLRPIWKALATAQMRIDRHVPIRATRRHRRIARDLAALIARMTRVVPGALVLVPELTPPAGKWERWFPGMAGRIEATNAAIRAVVETASASADVRWIPTVDLVERERAAGREPIPDGGHLSPQVHRLLGQRLGEEIATWTKTQDHLAR